jgi:DNA processing protein
MQTVGILAHGLDRIYPNENKSMAKKMIQQGGLLTEFMSLTRPDAPNFPMRNRIVAGLADAVIVIETGIKGGSMITADIANSYNKDVFALPGRIHDAKSIGCNYLIRENKASLFTNADEIAAVMNWDLKKSSLPKKQALSRKPFFHCGS